ncbi:MAG: NUDIX domain-containing protein [Spirochaetales bacterium]|nr:NUDIX domain-containing protein [Candidatus Physcosoma equi]
MTERTTTAGVAVKDGKYLVAQRMPGGPLSEKWEFVGGKNRWGETIEDTLKREWMEELSLPIEVGEYLTETEFENKGVHYTLKCHMVKPLSDEFKLNVHQSVQWVTKDELQSLSFGDSDSVILDYLVKNL